MNAVTQEMTAFDQIVAKWRQDVLDRFWARVDQTGGCWTWIGTVSTSGYGAFSVRQHFIYAHRFSYELAMGPIPGGLHVDHLCRNTLCVKPTHLEAVTPQENTRRGTSQSARNARKTHCPKGHPYDLINTWYLKTGRQCRVCGAERQRDPEFRARRNARRRAKRA